MLRLSKKADYALLAMRHLAANADRGAVSARELAEAYDLPPELLAKVLQQLVRGQLLTSIQGIRGRLRAGAARDGHLGRRRDQRGRRPAHRDGLFGVEPQLRAVRQVRHPRPALADQGPDRVRARRRRPSPGWRPSWRRLPRPLAAASRCPSPSGGSMITVTETRRVADRQAARRSSTPRRRACAWASRPAAAPASNTCSHGSRRRATPIWCSTARTACACGSIPAATGCWTGRRSTTTRA